MQTQNRTQASRRVHDVVIVGARCAGSATARLLARAGHDVVVVDRATFPSDTLSTHIIARTGVVQLSRWGLLDDVLAAGTPPIRQVVLHPPDGATRTLTIKDRSGVDLLVAPRRHVLDTLLVEAARRAGAQVRTGVTVGGVCRDGTGRVVGVHGADGTGCPVEVRARVVVGADGLHSRIARSVGAAMRQEHPCTGATHYAYFAGDWPAMEYHLADGAFAGIFPTNGGEACVWVCTRADDAERVRRRSASVEEAFTALLARSTPALAERVRDEAVLASPVRGVLRLPNHVRQATGPGWALVGDAGCHRDPVNGYGISEAFRDAEVLATALDRSLRGEVDDASALAGYEARRDALLADIFALTVAMARFPDAARFTELQKALGQAIDEQAAAVAAWPAPPALALTTRDGAPG